MIDLICGLILLLPGVSADGGDIELAKAIRTAHEANRARFKVWTMRFRYTVAKAPDLDSARERRWKGQATADGLFAWDGRLGRLDYLFSLKDLHEKRVWVGKGNYQTNINSIRYLTDGNVLQFDQISPDDRGKSLNHLSQINRGSESFHDRTSFPLDLGRTPGRETDRLTADIEAAVEGKAGYSMTILEGVSLDGADVVEMKFTVADRIEVERCYWVDLEHGAIPRRMMFTYREASDRLGKVWYVWDDVRRVGENDWYPYRELKYLEDGGRVWDTTITDADFSRPPDHSNFQMVFDEPIGVWDNVKMLKYPQQKVWDLDNLPQGMTEEQIRAVAVAPPKMPGERPPTPISWIIGTVALGVLLLALAVRTYRRRGFDG